MKTFKGEPITIGWGTITFLSNAITPGVCNGGLDDTLAAIADIYVVPTGTIYKNSSIRLKLPSNPTIGSPTTVVQGSGFFTDQLIASGLTEGTYSVIYDECQDGYFDDGIDFLMNPAFIVGSPVPPTPVPDRKERAKDITDSYAQMLELMNVMRLVSTFIPGADAWFYRTFLRNEANSPALDNDPSRVIDLLWQNIARFLAIYADPPDADFKQLTPLSGRQVIDLQSADLS